MTKRPGKVVRELYSSDLLVLGYAGTLRPRQPLPLTSHMLMSPAAEPFRSNPPSPLEEIAAPWIDEAASQLACRTPPALLVFRGEPIPLAGLLLILRDRIFALLTQAFHQLDSEGPESVCYNKLPALLHLLRSTVAEWTAASIVFLERFSRDCTSLAVAHGLDALPPIQAVSGCNSDVHAGGHSVLHVSFVGGATLYYKPRAMTGEWLWHELLQTIAQHDPDLRLPSARVLTRNDCCNYGWSDPLALEAHSVWASPMQRQPTAGAGADYWHRAGALLCLAQHTRLTDLHLANLLATPWGPAVVDAECLATPHVPGPPPDSGNGVRNLFNDALDSIYATGLISKGNAAGRPNVSGLFGHPGPVEGVRLPQWTLSPDGHYRLAPCAAELVDHGNAPGRTSAAGVLPQLAAGYRHAAEVLLSARKKLLGGGSRWRFVLEERHAPRVVVRDTLAYAQWISRSLAPGYLRSSRMRQYAIRLTVHSASEGRYSSALLRAEANALSRVHVPRFIVAPGSRALASSSGRAIEHGFTLRTASQGVLSELERLTRNHLDGVLLPALLTACLTA